MEEKKIVLGKDSNVVAEEKQKNCSYLCVCVCVCVRERMLVREKELQKN